MDTVVTPQDEPGVFKFAEQTVTLGHFKRTGVLQPFVVLADVYRPDEWTSLTIEAALTALKLFPNCRHIHDVGCGSGIIPLVLERAHPGRELSFLCSDVKPTAGRNLALNHEMFGRAGRRPDFHLVGGSAADGMQSIKDDVPPDLVIANIPQLPAAPAGNGRATWNPDDYHEVPPAKRDDPVRAFGLGLLMDVLAEARENHPGRFAAVFCRTSRIPAAVFDDFLGRVEGTVIHQGPEHRVRDNSTPFDLLAEAEDRFGHCGRYEWGGASATARMLRDRTPDRETVLIGLRSCLVEIG